MRFRSGLLSHLVVLLVRTAKGADNTLLVASSRQDHAPRDGTSVEKGLRGASGVPPADADALRAIDEAFAAITESTRDKQAGSLSFEERQELTKSLYVIMEEALNKLEALNVSQVPEFQPIVHQVLAQAEHGKVASSEAIEFMGQAVAASRSISQDKEEQQGVMDLGEERPRTKKELSDNQQHHRRAKAEDEDPTSGPPKNLASKGRPQRRFTAKSYANTNFDFDDAEPSSRSSKSRNKRFGDDHQAPFHSSHLHTRMGLLKDAIINGNHNVVREFALSFSHAHKQRFSHNKYQQEDNHEERRLGSWHTANHDWLSNKRRGGKGDGDWTTTRSGHTGGGGDGGSGPSKTPKEATRAGRTGGGGGGGPSKKPKEKMCETLKGCASKMSMYDMFTYFKSDDIDDNTGEVDENRVVFDDKDLKTKYDYIHKLSNQAGDLDGAQCDDLLSQFHRAVEWDDAPHWEGGTVSQVCHAEGTTAFVQLGQAAAASVIKPDPKQFLEHDSQGQSEIWRKVEGGLAQISAARDRTVWAFNQGGEIFRARSHDGHWVKMTDLPGGRRINSISVGHYTGVWATSTDNRIWCFDLVTQEWKSRPGEGVKVSVGADGTVWHIGDNDWAYRYDSQRGKWWEARGIEIQSISVGDKDNVWAVNHGQINQYDREKNKWNPRSLDSKVHMSTVTAASDGTVWATDRDNKVYRYNHKAKTWEQPTPTTRLSSISAGSELNVWGVSPHGHIYNYAGVKKLDFFKELSDRFLILVEAFAEEPVKCAEELFFASARTNDPRWSQETFVFSTTGGRSGDRSNYRFPTALDTSASSARTPHGQLKGNTKQGFEFTKYTDLQQEYGQCAKELRDVINAKLPEVFDDPATSEQKVIELTDNFVGNLTEDCIPGFFDPIQKGLELVFGAKPSPGFICGISEAVAAGRKKMPGYCCLDAPFQLDGAHWGNDYTCDLQCKTWGPFLAGASVQACDSQGGTWCPAPESDCSALKTCLAEELSWAKDPSTKRPAYEEYLKSAPRIKDAENHDECGKAREYFGFDMNFINDQQVCEDIHQLRFSRDFAFLDEFFNQGSDNEVPSGGNGGGCGDGVDFGEVPPMPLTPPDLEFLDAAPIQNGQKWRGSNFALAVWERATLFSKESVESIKCPGDPFFIVWNICVGLVNAMTKILTVIWYASKKILEISEFTYGEVAEVGNVEPLETSARVSAVYDHVKETGKYLQGRFAAISDSMQQVYEAHDSKLDDILEALANSDPDHARHLLASGDSSSVAAPSITLKVEAVSTSPKKLLVFTSSEGGVEVSPATLEVFALDLVADDFLPIEERDLVVKELSAGTRLVTLPETVASPHIRVRVSQKDEQGTERVALVVFQSVAAALK